MNQHRVFLVLAALLLLGISASAVTHQYSNLWAKPGLTVTSSSKGGLEMVYALQAVDISDVTVNGQVLQAVNIKELYLPGRPGSPDLPTIGRFVALPQGAQARVEVIAAETETVQNVELAPAPNRARDDDRGPLVYRKNAAVYSLDKNFPESPAYLADRLTMRGVDVAQVGITPFQYNPVTKQLTIYKNLRVRVTFEGGNGQYGEDRLRSRWWDNILAGNIANFDQLPAIDYSRRQGAKASGYEYVIITPADATCRAWADTLKQWRTLQGIKTGCFTTDSTGTTAAQIQAWIKHAYNTWAIPPVAVLLIGDWPGQGFSLPSPIVNDSYSGDYFPSDNHYSDVNGDSLPDLNVARIEAGTAQDLQYTIGKMMSYERNPYTDANFYNTPVSAMGYQPDRWFQICSEVIYGFWKNHLGKNPVRRYMPVSGYSAPTVGGPWSTASTYGNTAVAVGYWHQLGYIDSLVPAGITWTTSAAQISADINSGAFMVQHRDHGDTTAWGEPSYTNTNAAALTNTMYPFLFTINCLTGRYATGSTEFPGPSQCLGEAFYKQSHGVLGYIAPSDVSFSFDNDGMTWGMYDALWPDFDPGYNNNQHFGQNNLMPGFAHAYGKWYLKAHMTPWSILGSDSLAGAAVTYQLFHMHGDAFMTIYSQVPLDLTVNHPGVLTAGVTTFPVTADEGALIALTVNGEIIGTGTAPAKGTANIAIPGQTPGNTMVVTVTKANYRRYTGNVAISAAAGPYVMHLRHTMSDAAGNNDGVINPGETVRLPLWVINYGVAAASGVTATLRSGGPNGTVTSDSVYGYGTLAAGDSAEYGAGFGVLVNPADSNGVTIPLTLECRDDVDSTWTSSFSLTVGTAVLGYNGKGIGGNGRLDPSETAALGVSLKNNGMGYGYNTQAVLRCSDNRITVTDSTAGYGTVNPGATGASGADSFGLSIGSLPVGTAVTFTVVMKADGVADRSYSWGETVGDLRYSPTPDNSSGLIYYAVEDSDGVSRAPVYQWAEIRGVGTRLLGGDDSTKTATLPFTFKWYGTGYTTISACSNGWISFGSNSSTAYSNTALPTTTFATPTVFALWDDQDARTANASNCWVGYYNDAANHRFIVEYDSVIFYGSSTPRLKYEVIYYDSTVASPYYDVVVQYNLLSDQGSSSIGFQQNSTVGAQLLSSGAYASTMRPLGPGRAVRITRTPDVASGVAGEPQGAAALPAAYCLGQAYPNPGRGAVTLSYQLPRADRVELAVYNVAGQKVRTLVSGERPAGYHTARWDGRDAAGRQVSSGIYLYRLTTPNYARTGKLSLVR